MLGALMITAPLCLYGIWCNRFYPWCFAGVILGALFNWGVS